MPQNNDSQRSRWPPDLDVHCCETQHVHFGLFLFGQANDIHRTVPYTGNGEVGCFLVVSLSVAYCVARTCIVDVLCLWIIH